MKAAILFTAGLLTAPTWAAETERLRGELSFDGKQDYLRVCDSKKTLWVRVLASNPHFLLFKRVDRDPPDTLSRIQLSRQTRVPRGAALATGLRAQKHRLNQSWFRRQLREDSK